MLSCGAVYITQLNAILNTVYASPSGFRAMLVQARCMHAPVAKRAAICAECMASSVVSLSAVKERLNEVRLGLGLSIYWSVATLLGEESVGTFLCRFIKNNRCLQ